MRVPSSVNINCLKAFEPEKCYIKKWEKKSIKSFLIESWDSGIPKSLHELCVICIANNWEQIPILDEIILPEDRYLLLDILPETLPLQLTIPIINDEVFWKKCFVKRWPKKLPNITSECISFEHIVGNGVNGTKEEYVANILGEASGNNGRDASKTSSREPSWKYNVGSLGVQKQEKTWKKHYCEMHVKEYLENLKPEKYNPEKIKELCDLYGPYIESLEIDEMPASDSSSNKIPLNAILTGLPNLKNLILRFKQTHANTDFSWNIANTSYQDIHVFAKGLEKTRLKVLKVTNSDIDCDKAIIILKALLKHELEILDFSHCKIGDTGTQAIAKYIQENPIKKLLLRNNRIGSKGVLSLAYVLGQKSCKLDLLDLSLNSVLDDAGNLLLKSLVGYNENVNYLIISGCGFSQDFGIAEMLRSKNYLEYIDVSNNTLGEETGRKILEALNSNDTLKKLDLRMCKISPDVEAKIQNELNKNRKGLRKDINNAYLLETTICWDNDLMMEMDEILLLDKETERSVHSPVSENHQI